MKEIISFNPIVFCSIVIWFLISIELFSNSFLPAIITNFAFKVSANLKPFLILFELKLHVHEILFFLSSAKICCTYKLVDWSNDITTVSIVSMLSHSLFSRSHAIINLSIPVANPVDGASILPFNSLTRLAYLPPPINVGWPARPSCVELISKTKFV